MRYRAQVNKGLLAVLAVMVLIVGGYWWWKLSSEPTLPVAANAPPREYNLVCTACKNISVVKGDEWKTLPEDPETRNFQCPSCKKFAAVIERKVGGTALRPSGE